MDGHNGTTDYSYNIGPTQYKQSTAPKNAATKFSDLKFHYTALDFNKGGNSVQGQKQMTGNKRGNNSIDISGKQSHMGSAPKPQGINHREFQNTT
jgi:hypothetical protein